jgi:Lar family restriction alleviation protein
MLDLKPCPFCGGAAHFDHDDNGWNWIECADCGASTNARVSAMDDCKPLLAEQWNRRHTPAGVAGIDLPDYASRLAFLSTLTAKGQLLELLAVIHGDGGHYTNQHGRAKAVADAEVKWYGKTADGVAVVSGGSATATVAQAIAMGLDTGPAIDGVKACDLCAKGFPVENGQHHGTQALGMIPATPCTAGVPVVSASIPKQPLMAWLRKVLENTANSREERDAAGVLLRGLNADGVDLPDGAQP